MAVWWFLCWRFNSGRSSSTGSCYICILFEQSNERWLDVSQAGSDNPLDNIHRLSVVMPGYYTRNRHVQRFIETEVLLI
jgi:hypothetical protein